MKDRQMRVIISALNTKDELFQKIVQTQWKDQELINQYEELWTQIVTMIETHLRSKEIHDVFIKQESLLTPSE